MLKENFTYPKEDLMHVELSLAPTVLKPYINYQTLLYLKQCRSRSAWF